MFRRIVLVLLAAVLAGCSDGPTWQAELEEKRYIAVVNDEVPNAIVLAEELGRTHGFEVLVVSNVGLRFFAAEFRPRVLRALRRDPRIRYVVPDQKVMLG